MSLGIFEAISTSRWATLADCFSLPR